MLLCGIEGGCHTNLTNFRKWCCRGCGECLLWPEPSNEAAPVMYDSPFGSVL